MGKCSKVAAALGEEDMFQSGHHDPTQTQWSLAEPPKCPHGDTPNA